MPLLNSDQRAQLLANGRAQRARPVTAESLDFVPVLKIFTPDAGATWLLSELDPYDEDTAFGLCDLGLGCPELGSVSVRDLEGLRGKLGLSVQVDLNFQPEKVLSGYAADARRDGGIRV